MNKNEHRSAGGKTAETGEEVASRPLQGGQGSGGVPPDQLREEL